MKLARAKRLGGELIDSINGSHDDCKLLDMVCDNCGESVIYRQAHSRTCDKGQVHIDAVWVHRSNKFPELQQECDLRVNSESTQSILARRSETRGQRYKLMAQSLWAMHYKFNNLHYKAQKAEGSSWKPQLKFANSYWANAKPRQHYLAEKIQAKMKAMSVVRLSDLISQVYELRCEVKDLISSRLIKDISSSNPDILYSENLPRIISHVKKNYEKSLAEFRSNVIPDFHLMLCREVIEYCLKESQIPVFKLIFGTYAFEDHMVDRQDDDLIIVFVRRICMTDWVEAYNWARSEFAVNKNKGFAKV